MAESSYHCPNCEPAQLEALYCLNIVAKGYAEAASESYNSNLKQLAQNHSQRKDALYSLKDTILTQFVSDSCVDDIEVHQIDGKKYYCIYVGGYSYHSPVSQWDEPPDDAPESTTTLEGFTADPDSRSSDLTKQEALTRLSEQFESPNHHIEIPFTSDDNVPRFVGWSYLPGALEEGDKVPDQYLSKHNGDQDFVFEIGDTFETAEGQCEVVDCYHAYLTPLYDRSPLLQRPAYDVLLDGERRECVTEKEMTDEWEILADDIQDPLPNVDGQMGDIAGSAADQYTDGTVDFSPGDILELKPKREGGDPMYCRLTKLHVSGNLLIGQYEPVPPSENAPAGLAIEEIADDVVRVHDTPPAES